MTTIRLTDGIVKDDVLVVGLATKAGKSAKASFQIESGDLPFDPKPLLQALSDLGATGKADEVVKVAGISNRLIVFTGLGKVSTSYDSEVLRRAAGAAARSLSGHASATFALPAKDIHGLTAIAEGAGLGSYLFDSFRGTTQDAQKTPLKSITVFSLLAPTPAAKDAAKSAEVIATYTNLVRDLINTPPSHLTPDSFTKKMAAVVKAAGGSKSGLKVQIWDEKQLKSQGFGGIIGVGQGSANPPRLLHISYTPKGKVAKRYAFVGKGITFDTGGLALKPAAGMEAMKSDMSGAAAVSAAVVAIAELKLNVAIDAWAPLAENMPSDTATRPSDIITIFGGKTVEVLNPDAEGRLVLADALMKAQSVNSKLDGIIDVATLTGAQVVALGTRTSAVMTNNPEFSEAFMKVTAISGEQFWPMPLPEELRASLDSPVADLANIGDRMGGMLVAGLFLKDFVSADLPWLHLDIAGPAYNEAKPHGYTPVGGTGISLRSLVTLAEQG